MSSKYILINKHQKDCIKKITKYEKIRLCLTTWLSIKKELRLNFKDRATSFSIGGSTKYLT